MRLDNARSLPQAVIRQTLARVLGLDVGKQFIRQRPGSGFTAARLPNAIAVGAPKKLMKRLAVAELLGGAFLQSARFFRLTQPGQAEREHQVEAGRRLAPVNGNQTSLVHALAAASAQLAQLQQPGSNG